MNLHFFVLIPLLLCSCATQDKLKGPRADRGHTLQPTLRWPAFSEPGVTYDLVVYETLKLGRSKIPGREVVYVEGLTENMYTIPFSLQDRKKYLWTVRDRRGTVANPWVLRDRFIAGYMPGFITINFTENEMYLLKPRSH